MSDAKTTGGLRNDDLQLFCPEEISTLPEAMVCGKVPSRANIFTYKLSGVDDFHRDRRLDNAFCECLSKQPVFFTLPFTSFDSFARKWGFSSSSSALDLMSFLLTLV